MGKELEPPVGISQIMARLKKERSTKIGNGNITNNQQDLLPL